jgi:hypothetical protein
MHHGDHDRAYEAEDREHTSQHRHRGPETDLLQPGQDRGSHPGWPEGHYPITRRCHGKAVPIYRDKIAPGWLLAQPRRRSP